MATAQTTVQQYEPLRPPSAWSAEERKLVQQLTDRFDDLYGRFNRLRFEDLGTKLQKRLSDTEATLEVQADKIEAKVDSGEYQTNLTLTSEAIGAVASRIETVESELPDMATKTELATNLTLTSDAINAASTRVTSVESALPGLATKTDLATQYAAMKLTSDGLAVRIGSAEGNVTGLLSDAELLKAFKNVQETIIRLESVGIIVGSTANKTSVLIAPDRVAIRDQYNNEVTKITDNIMEIENAAIHQQLTVGLVARVRLGDGSCGDKWIGA